MFKKLLFGIASTFMLYSSSKAQLISPDSIPPRCGISAEYIATLGKSSDFVSIPSPFPSTAKEYCGKFEIYYYDKAYHPGEGFDDPSVGATRRNTLCSVLTYIQSVYDFSNIPSGKYIRLRVDTSFTHTYHRTGPVAYGAPFYSLPIVPGSIVNGFVHDYLTSTTGTDPDTTSFHCDLRLNFDSIKTYFRYKLSPDGGKTIAVDFQNGLGAVSNCQYDLYSAILHEMGHSLGYIGMYGPTTAYSSFDTSIRTGPSPYDNSTAFTAPLIYYTTTWGSSLGMLWIDNSPAPYRVVPEYLGHLRDDYYGDRISSGTNQEYVMGELAAEGEMKRTFSKEELRIGNTILGLYFHPTAFSGSSSSAFNYSNHRPYCSRNYDIRYNDDFFDEKYYFDTLAADFSLVNNVASNLAIHLASDTTLHDDDGDTIRYIPESVINFRGTGQGGNNHNLLSFSNGNRTITYTPRANFYGRVQFGVNISDGKETGAFVLYTIDIAKGNNVSVAAGSNLVLNGDFEEGTEVKVKDSAEEVNNLGSNFGSSYFNAIKAAGNFADCQPYSNSVAIRNSYADCSETSKVKYNFGNPFTSFPWAWDTIVSGTCYYKYHEAYLGQGNRYQNTFSPSLYLLGDSVRKCHNYLLELDLIYTNAPLCYPYPSVDTIYVAFTDGSHIIKTVPKDAFKNQSLPPYPVSDATIYNWKHVQIPLTYCSDTPSNILYIHVLSAGPVGGAGCSDCRWGISSLGAFVLVDNVSLKEQDFTASITDTLSSPCITRLIAQGSSINACGSGITYEWRILGTSTIVSTDKMVDVSPESNTSYELTVTNGCAVAKDTVTVQGSICPCSPADVFGDTVGFYSFSGTVSSLPVQNYYYVTDNVTFTSDINIQNANVLIAPGVTITVADSVKLTLDSAHLFTCPSDTFMWRGIVLASGTAKSARIEVKNNCLIEDALFAIDAMNLKTPSSGDVVNVTYSTFNRNQVDISMNGYTASSSSVLPITIVGNLFTARDFNDISMPGYPNTWTPTRTLKATTSVTDSKPSYYISKTPFLNKIKCKDKSIFSYLGIRASNIGVTSGAGVYQSEIEIGEGLVIDDYNLFDNHDFGIFSYNSNISIYHSHFINISKRMLPDTSTTFPVGNGMGVNLQSSRTNNNRVRLLPSPYFGNFPNKFHDCYQGIYTENIASLQIRYCEITTSNTAGATVAGAAYPTDTYQGYGMMIHSDRNLKENDIAINRISNNHVGMQIHLTNSASAANTILKANIFNGINTAIDAVYTGGQYLGHAIKLFCSSPLAAMSNTATIEDNKIYKVFNGIEIGGLTTTRCTTKNNEITLWDTLIVGITNEQYGIQANVTNDGQIINNPISSSTGTLTADRIRAVKAAFNTSLRICSNTATNIGRGFEFAAGAAQTGTRWISNTMDNGYKGMILASDIGDQGFTYNWVGLPLVYWGATLNKWKGSWSIGSSKFQTVGIGYTNTMNSKLWVKDIPSGTVERPTVNYAIPTPFIPYIYNFSGTLGSVLTTQPETNCSGDILPIKYKPIPSGGLSGGKTLGLLIIADSLGYDSTYHIRQWMNQLSLYQMGTIDPEQRDSSAALDSFMIEAVPSRFAWLTEIELAINNNDLTTAQSLLDNPVAAMGRVVINGDLIITDYDDADAIVQNYTDYYHAYLKYLQDTMTGSDTAMIESIAHKCPAIDGAVVFSARALYQRISMKSISYFDDSCEFNGGQYRMVQNPSLNGADGGNNYSIYPNPNNGSFVLNQLVAENKTVNLKVYNSIGALVYQAEAEFVNGQTNVTLSQKARGVYLVCIGDDKERSTCLRFIIN